MNAGTECTVALPQYRSHKVVGAAKILNIFEASKIDLGPHGILDVGNDWIIERSAQIGGYYVAYEDGYTSYSPAKAFEEGYRQVLAPAPGTVAYCNPNPETRAALLTEARHILAHPHMMSDERTLRRLLGAAIAEVDAPK